MTIKLIGLNQETGFGAVEAKNEKGTALIDFKINPDGSVKKGWVKYSITVKHLADFQEEIKLINMKHELKKFPDYWTFTKLPVTIC